MMIKVPSRVNIGAQTYTIKFLHDEIFNDNEFGAAWHRKQEITIDPSCHATQRYSTLLHEIIHLIEKAYTFRIDDNDTDRMASGLTEFLRDNLGIELDWSDISDIKED